MSARYERKYKHLNYDGSWNVFVSESCVDSIGVAIKTMGFLKAISEDSDNRGCCTPRSFSAHRTKRLHGIFCRLPRFRSLGLLILPRRA
jgi:hypothetical protein